MSVITRVSGRLYVVIEADYIRIVRWSDRLDEPVLMRDKANAPHPRAQSIFLTRDDMLDILTIKDKILSEFCSLSMKRLNVSNTTEEGS